MFSFREFFTNIARHRYTLAAHNICFTNPAFVWYNAYSLFWFIVLKRLIWYFVGSSRLVDVFPVYEALEFFRLHIFHLQKAGASFKDLT